VFVKICGITTEEDALLAVALGADALGFVFAPSSRQISPARAAEIVARLPADILTVGVFRDELPERVIQIVHRTGLRAAQLHGAESADAVARVKADVPVVFKAVVAGSEDASRADRYVADAILVDAPSPGSGQVFDWSLAEDAPREVRLIMAGGLNPENVAEAIAKVQPFGVDVSSGVEREPGHKDPLKLRDFITAARSVRLARRSLRSDDGPYNWEEDPTWR
jgi:phosphoribosylanthranilate isomerase